MDLENISSILQHYIKNASEQFKYTFKFKEMLTEFPFLKPRFSVKWDGLSAKKALSNVKKYAAFTC